MHTGDPGGLTPVLSIVDIYLAVFSLDTLRGLELDPCPHHGRILGYQGMIDGGPALDEDQMLGILVNFVSAHYRFLFLAVRP